MYDWLSWMLATSGRWEKNDPVGLAFVLRAEGTTFWNIWMHSKAWSIHIMHANRVLHGYCPRLGHIRYGASLGGPHCHTHNPILRLFSRTFLHMTSDDDQSRPHLTAQPTWQTTSPWWWRRSPLRWCECYESMPLEGWAAFRIYFFDAAVEQF